jgi:mannose-6-phosphate isomerase class I
MEMLMLEPIFKDAIWGGNLLNDFGYEKASSNAGECWGISAHEKGDCIVKNGALKGKTLSWCYKNHRELFGNIQDEVFPLLVKILGAEDDLSIQVHPDDEYAKKNENGALGKTECWYILDCREDATIVIGHHAKDKSDLERMITEKRWSELIREVPIKKGDFFQINPGCLHAIKGGTLLIETQQSSDVTYRVYDYDRRQNGQLRELHIRQSIDCINAPHKDYKTDRIVNKSEQLTKELLVSCQYYTLERWEVKGEYRFKMDKPFMNVSVIDGEGYVNNNKIKKGDHFIITSAMKECAISGDVEIMVSYV